MNKYTAIAVMLFLTGLLAFPMIAVSQNTSAEKQTTTMGMNKERGHWKDRATSNLTTEQREQIEKLHKKFREDNADTIKQLMTKRFDLNTALNSDKPDLEKAKAIQKEISDLNAKLAQKRIDLYMEVRKINPDSKFGGGMGRGLRMVRKMHNERMHEGMGT